MADSLPPRGYTRQTFKVAPFGDMVAPVCDRCGVPVWDMYTHDVWHEREEDNDSGT